MRTLRIPFLNTGLASVAILMAGGLSVRAADIVHNLTTTGATTWNTATWTNGVPNAVGDVAAFTGTTAGTTTLDIDVTLGVVRNSGTGGPGSWTINSDGTHVLTMDGTGLTAANNPYGIAGEAALALATNASFIVNPNIVIANTNLGVGTNGNSQITINGNITATTDQTINIRGGGSGGIAFGSTGSIGTSGSGNITISNANNGTSALQLNGVLGAKVAAVTQNSSTASMSLSGDNSAYAGTTTLQQGSITATSSTGTNSFTSFGTGAIVLNGGTLSLRSNGNGTSNQTLVAGNNVTMGGNVAVFVDRVSSVSGSTIQFNDLAIGANTLTLTGGNSFGLRFAGTTTASGAATFMPNTAGSPLTLGNLTLADSLTTGTTTTITLGGVSTGSAINGVVSDNGSDPTKVLALTKIGTGTWNLNGTSASTYTGPTTVNGGTLFVDLRNLATPTNMLNPSSLLTLGGGTLRIYGKTSTTSDQTLGNLTLTGDTGLGKIIVSSPTAGVNTNLTLGDTWTRGAGSTLQINLADGTSGTNTLGLKSLTSNPTLTNGILGYAVALTGTGGTVNFATVSGGKIAGYTTPSSLAAGSDNATTNFTTSGTLTHNAGDWSANSLQFGNSTSTLDIGGGILSLTSGAVLTRTTTGGTLTTQITNGQLGATDSELIFHSYSSASTLIGATISGGTGRFTLDGGTRVVLTGNNTYTGNTVVGGITTLQIGNAGTAGSISGSSSVIVTTGSTLAYNRTDADSVKNLTGGGILSVNSGTLTLNQSGAANLVSITGATGATVEFAGNGSGVTTVGDPLTGSLSSMIIAGQNYKFTNGTVNFVDTGRGVVSNLEIVDGIVNSSASQFSMTGIASGTQTFTMSGGQFNQSGAFGLKGFNGNGGAGGVGLANSTFIGNQSGGTISITGIQGNNRGGLEFGSTSAGNSTTYNFSGGEIGITTGGLFNVGADTGGSSSTTFNFSGGKLFTNGTIQGNQAAGAKQAFVWTGGTLAAATYNAANLTSTAGQAVVTGTTNILTNAGGILAPGDIGTAGRTVINGNYSVTSDDAALAIDIGGTLQGNAFQNTADARYDFVNVNAGAASLGGKLQVGLINGYTPPNNTTQLYNVVTNTGTGAALSGTFTNLMTATGGNQRVVLADGLSSFLVGINTTGSTATTGGLTSVGARTVALGGYQAANTYTGAGTAWDTAAAGAWANFDAGATVTPGTQASGAIAQFADGTASTGSIDVSLNSTRNIQGIQFASASGSRAYTISNGGSGALILDNTGNAAAATIADTSASGTTNAVNVPLTLNSNLAVSVANVANTLALGGVVSGTGKTLTKTGAGTLALSGDNTFTGGVAVSDGTLLVNNLTGSGTGTGALTVASGATLGGSGFIGGVTTIAGTLSPGNSPGVLTFNEAVTLQSGSAVMIEINGAATRGTDYDGVNFDGGLTIDGGALTFNISAAIADGATLNIFDGTALTATFTSVAATGTGGYDGVFAINEAGTAYTRTFGEQTLSLALDTGELSFIGAAIPEPATYAALLGAAGLACATLRRRSRKA